MQEPKARVREKTPEEASGLADTDCSRDPKEFLREIYKEAYNNEQDGCDQISKVMMKVSALLIRISADHEEIHRSIRRWTVWLVALTIVLSFLTAGLFAKEAYHVYKEYQLAHQRQAKHP